MTQNPAHNPHYDKLIYAIVHVMEDVYNDTQGDAVPDDYAGPVMDVIWPEIEKILQEGIRSAKDQLAEGLDSFADSAYGQEETASWRRGIKDAAQMLRARPEGQ